MMCVGVRADGPVLSPMRDPAHVIGQRVPGVGGRSECGDRDQKHDEDDRREQRDIADGEPAGLLDPRVPRRTIREQRKWNR